MTEGHRWSAHCMIANKCADCHRKWLNEDVDTLPFSAEEMAAGEEDFMKRLRGGD